jgi:hypothetical protein
LWTAYTIVGKASRIRRTQPTTWQKGDGESRTASVLQRLLRRRFEFYRRALGAQVTTLMRMKDSPEPPPSGKYPPGTENNVMHASFQIGETQLMASDSMPGSKPI